MSCEHVREGIRAQLIDVEASLGMMVRPVAGMAELVDAGDLKFPDLWSCRFESGYPHHHPRKPWQIGQGFVVGCKVGDSGRYVHAVALNNAYHIT